MTAPINLRFVRPSQAGQPNGYVAIDANGFALIDHLLALDEDAYATLETYPDVAGELMTVANGLFTNDGAMLHPVGLSSPAALVVGPWGANAAASGVLLQAAYTAAAALTPYGSALSTTNRAAVVVLPGKYTLSGNMTLAAYVDLFGFPGLEPQITMASGQQITGLGDQQLRNLEIIQAATGTPPLAGGGTITGMLWQNVKITCAATTEISTILNSQTNFVSCQFRNVKTNGIRLLGGMLLSSPATVFDANCILEDCEGGDYSFGSHITSAAATKPMLATMRRCRLNSTVAQWLGQFGGVMEYCTFKAGIARIDNTTQTPRFRFSTIAPAASAKCIDAASALNAYVYQMAHKSFSGAATLGTNVTNLVNATPASAGIIESDNIAA